MQTLQGLLPVHAPPHPGVRGDEAGAARRRGPGALQRRLHRRAHLRPERGGGRPGRRGRAGAGPQPPAEPERQPDGEDRGAGRGFGGGAAGLVRRRAVDVRELGHVAGDLGLQPAARLVPAVRARRRRRAVRVRGGGVRPFLRCGEQRKKKTRDLGALVEDSTRECLEWISGEAVMQGIGGRRLDNDEFWQQR